MIDYHVIIVHGELQSLYFGKMVRFARVVLYSRYLKRWQRILIWGQHEKATFLLKRLDFFSRFLWQNMTTRKHFRLRKLADRNLIFFEYQTKMAK